MPTPTTICETCKLAHGPLIECLSASRQAMIDLLYRIGDEAQCRGCGARIVFVTHKNGKKTPYTPEGLVHFLDCPVANRFKTAGTGR